MYEPIEGGSIEEVCGLICYIPPVPPKHGIAGSHLPIEDQKWKRVELPDFYPSDIKIWSGEEYTTEKIDWDTARREEIIKQTGTDPWDTYNGKARKVNGIIPDPEYISEPLEVFRNQELDKTDPVTGGYWFMNHGEPTYITPFHYFYINWWEINIGYPEYRDADRRMFYFWQHNYENPNSLGVTEVAKRGSGKTFRATSIVYLESISYKNIFSAIQSKTEIDAEKIFQVKMVPSYQSLPDFYVPINNNSSSPTKELTFTAPPKKGQNSTYYRKLQKKALNSRITFSNAKENAYDGDTVNGILFRDEEGKTTESNVYDRHLITKECVYRDGKVFGKIYSTTTVEEIDKGGENFKKIWDRSNQYDLAETGSTKSGLFKFMLPAYETEFFDEYGFGVIENPTPKQKEYLAKRYGQHAIKGARPLQKMRRKEAEGDPQALLKEILQNPWTEKELFMAAGENCQYNLTILRTQEQIVNDPEFNPVRVGDFVFKDGIGSEVTWVDNEANGKWNVSYLFDDPKKANQFTKRTARPQKTSNVRGISDYNYLPTNTHKFTGGFDPTKTSKSVDKRRSKAAGTIFMKYDMWNEEISETWVADFVWEPDDPEKAWEYFLAGCFYYGCQFLPEDNVGVPVNLFKAIGCHGFIMWRPESTYTVKKGLSQAKEGIPSNEKTNDQQLKKKQSNIIHHGHKLMLPRVIKDSIVFDPAYRTKYDLEVASQLSLIATEKFVEDVSEKINVGTFFKRYDNSGTLSKAN